MTVSLRIAEIKRDNEKLLRVAVGVNDDTIVMLELSGDFFIHPEEGIVEIQKCVAGMPLDENLLVMKINKCLTENEIEMVGLSPETVAIAIIDAR